MAFTEGFYNKPRIDWALLHERAEGLICLSGCVAGAIPRMINAGNYEGAKNKALELSELFGRDGFYLEIQDHGLEAEKSARPRGFCASTARPAFPCRHKRRALCRKRRRVLSGRSDVRADAENHNRPCAHEI